MYMYKDQYLSVCLPDEAGGESGATCDKKKSMNKLKKSCTYLNLKGIVLPQWPNHQILSMKMKLTGLRVQTGPAPLYSKDSRC